MSTGENGEDYLTGIDLDGATTAGGNFLGDWLFYCCGFLRLLLLLLLRCF